MKQAVNAPINAVNSTFDQLYFRSEVTLSIYVLYFIFIVIACVYLC